MRQHSQFRLHFPVDLVVTPLSDAKFWRIDQEFGYVTSKRYGSMAIKVAVDFATDFASVPLPFRWIIPKWGKYGWAAVVHDWLYSEQMYCKEFADDIFYEAMLISGVHPCLSKIMYLAVSWFGMSAWLSASAKLRLGKTKRAVSGADSIPNWHLPISQQLGEMRREWHQHRTMCKPKKL